MSELRERKKPANATEQAPAKAHAGAHKDMDKLEVFLLAAADKIPNPNVKKYYLMVIPYIVYASLTIETTLPHIEKAIAKGKEYQKKLEPYRLHLLLPSVAGLIMCFFGGEFMTLIAAVEAYHQVGQEATMAAIRELINDWNTFVVANKKDNAADDDHDGIADVAEISNEQLVMRKTLLFLRVVDPYKVTKAFDGLQHGVLAIVATLKLQFAKAITLGGSIAKMLRVPSNKFVVPVMRSVLPPEYERWAEVIVDYFIHYVAISIAWTIQRLISTVHSAVRGGLLCSRNIMEYLTEMKIYEIDHEKSMLDEILGYVLAALGISFQIGLGFRLPFPLNVLLLPLTIAERVLMWLVNENTSGSTD